MDEIDLKDLTLEEKAKLETKETSIYKLLIGLSIAILSITIIIEVSIPEYYRSTAVLAIMSFICLTVIIGALAKAPFEYNTMIEEARETINKKQREILREKRIAEYNLKIQEEENAYNTLIEKLGTPSKIINSLKESKDDRKKLTDKILIFEKFNKIFISGQEFNFSDIIDCQVLSQPIYHKAPGSDVRKYAAAALTNVIVNDHWSAAEFIAAEKPKAYLSHYEYTLIIIVNNFAEPRISMFFGSNPSINDACAAFSVILDKNNKNIVEVQQNQNSFIGSVADELTKLAKLKEQGILTEEEFAEQKKRLLNR